MAQDPYKYFRIEAGEILDDLGKGVLSLEKGPPAADVVPRLLRLAHTLKGAARVVKQREVADLAHTIEDALAPLRDGASAVTRAGIDGMLKHLDAIAASVAALAPPSDVAPGPAPHPLAEDAIRTLRAGVEEMDALLDGVAEVSVQLATVRHNLRSLEQVRHLSELLASQLAMPKTHGAGNGAASKTRSMAGELQSLVAGLERELVVGVEQTERELGQVREAAERLRLVPAGLMWSSLERAVRDAAMSLGKKVTFEAKGGEVRLDADMLGSVQRALVQAARNAVAHGLEGEAERTARGKPSAGKVTMEVVRAGNRISFTCRDDGRGVDLDAVRRAVQARGLLPKDGPKLGAGDLLRLLLKAGISTSERVTEVSGRGIGLDVVRETAHRLGGDVAVRTESGKGTVLEIIIPVSLSSLDALIVEVGGQHAAIPLDTVRHTLRLQALDLTQTAEGSSILHEGDVIPFAPLSRLLGGDSHVSSALRAWSAVIVESHGALAALGVDRLVGTENIVLRPLPPLTPADARLSGVSLGMDGNPRLVLDADGLLAEARESKGPAKAALPVRHPILVIDDSLTTRMLEQSILESAGYEVHVATSGEEGLEKAYALRYGLFLVDVEMPGMDGFTFIQKSRADPVLKSVPAILVTSRASAEDKRRGEAVGARAYIVKGEFDQKELLDRVRTLLG
jgi:two-component system chemotaxis sensor kinase CheA